MPAPRTVPEPKPVLVPIIMLDKLIGREILDEKSPDPRNENRGPDVLLQLDLNQ